MEQERINQILAEKEAGEELRRIGVEIDLGDHRTRVEILAFIRECMGVKAVEQTCQIKGRGRLRWEMTQGALLNEARHSSIGGATRV